jgi:carbon monoxide dehydrogenase subunit G
MFSYAGRIGNMYEKVSYRFYAVGEGTRTSMTGEGEMGILGELLAPMFSRMASKNAQSQLNRLRVALEAQNGLDE